MSSHPGRHRRRRQLFSGAAAALAIGGGVAFAAIPGTASAAGPSAVYVKTGDWSTGYSAQYQVSNPSGGPSAWKLTFTLPAGAKITSLWNASYTVSGQQVTVTPPAWQPTLPADGSVDVGFVVSGGADPTECRINGADCTTPGSTPTTSSPPVTTSAPSSAPTTAPSTSKTTTTRSTPSTTTSKPATDASGRFAPYVDTSLYPPYDLISTANATGVKDFTLAFVLSGGGCTPKWGGVSELNTEGVPGQIGRLRELGGDVRVSFGGAAGIELAQACTDASSLASAYGKVISTYGLSKVDFDIEGGALGDVAANTRRAQAIAQLQQQAAAAGRTLDVSFTLPVLPSGLTQDGVNLLQNAKANGVTVHAVNVMAMDYGDGAAPNPSGRMGQFAIDAATATQAQVKSVLGLPDADAWHHVAVTPMIGVNDVATEVFTVADAKQLAEFASGKGLAWLAMWSATRDQPCPGGPAGFAQATCSSIAQQPLDFTRAFAAF
ncbi:MULTISPECIES: glycoside hydrolase family 18 protein [Amycolatopsis]|uniref:chitinase n=2 Tax=Amycolatopsis TaxID=1813 RepID=A0A1I3PV85_9PSEU|nr:cellulose binding domain-containing protein [Amycolatopsis sacchari]SFJ25111.1 Glycosyl hydrolases family 18 [Amycolatopsis sacchari]